MNGECETLNFADKNLVHSDYDIQVQLSLSCDFSRQITMHYSAVYLLGYLFLQLQDGYEKLAV